MDTFLWHDYETFGAQPMVDRPAQFAALRTDTRLEEVGEPVTWYCQPVRDVLPHPMACLVTGITPQRALERGIPEPEFAARIERLMGTPGTCGVGYNSLRFDDEVTRHLLYRNFFDPYEREWKNGNSRFDLINLARMCYALRPGGMHWPEHEPGVPSFRLEDLASANGIGHEDAHDALADVRATLELARRLRRAQPRLWDWALTLRETRTAEKLLDPASGQPLVHSSGRIAAARGATTLVLPLLAHPAQKRAVICYDLAHDPADLLAADADDIADRLYTPQADLPEGVERIPLKLIRANRTPTLAPAAVLRGVDTERIGLDPERCQRHAKELLAHRDALRSRLLAVYAEVGERAPAGDPELALYDGFVDNADRDLAAQLRQADPADLAGFGAQLRDPRLRALLFRYRARHHRATLDAAEDGRWREEVGNRLSYPPDDRMLGWAGFEQELALARQEQAARPDAPSILAEVDAWAGDLDVPRPVASGNDAGAAATNQ